MRLFTRLLAFPFRLLGFAFFVLLCAAAVYDGFRSFEAGAVRLSPLGSLWFEISPETLNLAQALVQRYVSPVLWDPIIMTLLAWPAVVSLLLLSVLFGLVARLVHRPR